VREVGVHLDEHLVPALDADREPRPVRLAQPLLLGAAQDVDLAELLRDALGDVCRPVGAVVVDDEDVDRRRELADASSMFSTSR